MCLRCYFAIPLVFLFSGLVAGETPGRSSDPLASELHAGMPPSLPTLGLPDLVLLTRHSGMIFSGTALKVEHLNPESASGVASTRTTFRVVTAIRGVRRGQILQIREWDGLWNSGERYQPGERVLLFLFPPSRLGLTSPVGESLGRFSVDDGGRVELQGAPGSGPRPKPIEVRNLAAEVRRAGKGRGEGLNEGMRNAGFRLWRRWHCCASWLARADLCVAPNNSPCQVFNVIVVAVASLQLQPVAGSLQIAASGQSLYPVVVRVVGAAVGAVNSTKCLGEG